MLNAGALNYRLCASPSAQWHAIVRLKLMNRLRHDGSHAFIWISEQSFHMFAKLSLHHLGRLRLNAISSYIE